MIQIKIIPVIHGFVTPPTLSPRQAVRDYPKLARRLARELSEEIVRQDERKHLKELEDAQLGLFS